VVTAYLRASLEADRLLAAEPEKYSELIAKVTGIDAEVNYLFHGPLGLQTRDLTWKPEYRQAVATSIDTLKLLKSRPRPRPRHLHRRPVHPRRLQGVRPGLGAQLKLRANAAQGR
jgi:ABC-type nitrate/sulfonate/bicarbonate transport system substrate-binding protein